MVGLLKTKQTNLRHDGWLRSRTECIHRLKPHVSLAAASFLEKTPVPFALAPGRRHVRANTDP